MKISAILEDYLSEHVLHKVVARERIVYAIKALEPFFGKLKPEKITILTCRQYTQQRKVHQNTVRRELTVLRAAINHAFKCRRIDRPVFIELPDSIQPEIAWLTEEELKALWLAADDRTKDFIEIAYYTAARRETVETMQKGQVDLGNNRINLNRPGRRKTCKGRPIVPIHPDLRPTLERCMEKPGTYLLGHTGKVYQPFMRAVKRAGIAKPITPHSLRHSRATHMLQRGETLFSVAQWLGDTVSTIEKTYGHHSPDYLATGMSSSGVLR